MNQPTIEELTLKDILSAFKDLKEKFESKGWKKVGKFKDVIFKEDGQSDFLKKYTVEKYEFGVKGFGCLNILPIIWCDWDKGYGIKAFVTQNILHGDCCNPEENINKLPNNDNPTNGKLHFGTVVFSKGTSDMESKRGYWVFRFISKDAISCERNNFSNSENGARNADDIDIYVRML